MGQYRASLTFAAAGGQRVKHGEVVDIGDADLIVYQSFIDRGWLTEWPPLIEAPREGFVTPTRQSPEPVSSPEREVVPIPVEPDLDDSDIDLDEGGG